MLFYDKSKKGFYVQQRHYEYEDIRLLQKLSIPQSS